MDCNQGNVAEWNLLIQLSYWIGRRWLMRRSLLPHLDSHLSVPLGIKLRVQQTGAAVPAQDGIVVAGWTNPFRLFVRMHGFFQENGDCVGRATRFELGLCPTLRQQACVVELLVSVAYLLKSINRGRVWVGSIT